MADKIFINYRREESGHVAGRLHDRLAQAFGRDNLFMDVDNIPVGVDFVTHLNDQVAACDAVLVVIGPKWAKAKDKAGQRRLHQPDDFVAIEIAAALTRDIRVIPVLVDGARMPRASELPDALKPLARRQAAEVRHVNFGQDADTLVARMRKSLGDKTLDKGGPETVGDKAAVVLELERLAAQEREAKAEAETEAKRKADEAEQQRLAAAKAEQERQVREVAEAERQANIRAEQERQKQAEAEARQQAELEARRLEAKRRAEEEQQRKQLEAKAREAEAKRLADEEKRRKRAEREPLIATMGKALADKARGQDRWRVGAIAGVAAVAVLLLIGWGGYAFVQRTYTTVEKTVQQREAVKAEQERQARAAAEAEEKRNAEEAERQRLAKAEQERQARAAWAVKAATSGYSELITQGDKDIKAGNYDRAIATLTEAIKRYVFDYVYGLETAFTFRGMAYESKGDNDRAIADYKRGDSIKSQLRSRFLQSRKSEAQNAR